MRRFRDSARLATLVCQQPPTAQNFAIGFVGEKKGGAFSRHEGWWESEGCQVEPGSLYRAQLNDRGVKSLNR